MSILGLLQVVVVCTCIIIINETSAVLSDNDKFEAGSSAIQHGSPDVAKSGLTNQMTDFCPKQMDSNCQSEWSSIRAPYQRSVRGMKLYDGRYIRITAEICVYLIGYIHLTASPQVNEIRQIAEQQYVWLQLQRGWAIA